MSRLLGKSSLKTATTVLGLLGLTARPTSRISGSEASAGPLRLWSTPKRTPVAAQALAGARINVVRTIASGMNRFGVLVIGISLPGALLERSEHLILRCGFRSTRIFP